MGSGNWLVCIQRLMATVAMGFGQFQRFLSCDLGTGLHKIYCNCYTCFYIFKVFFAPSMFPPPTPRLPLWIWLSYFWMWYAYVRFFRVLFLSGILSCLTFFEPPGPMVCCHSFWKNLGHFYFKYFLSSLFFFLCVCVPIIYILHFFKLPHNSWMFQGLFVFFPYFFLCISFWQVSIDISWNSLILPMSNDEPIKFIIYFCYRFFFFLVYRFDSFLEFLSTYISHLLLNVLYIFH